MTAEPSEDHENIIVGTLEDVVVIQIIRITNTETDRKNKKIRKIPGTFVIFVDISVRQKDKSNAHEHKTQ